MDIQMPKIDGTEAFKILQAEPLTRNIPIIALTSYAMTDDREKFLSNGFSDYIAKPISIDELLVLFNFYCTWGLLFYNSHEYLVLLGIAPRWLPLRQFSIFRIPFSDSFCAQAPSVETFPDARLVVKIIDTAWYAESMTSWWSYWPDIYKIDHPDRLLLASKHMQKDSLWKAKESFWLPVPDGRIHLMMGP